MPSKSSSKHSSKKSRSSSKHSSKKSRSSSKPRKKSHSQSREKSKSKKTDSDITEVEKTTESKIIYEPLVYKIPSHVKKEKESILDYDIDPKYSIHYALPRIDLGFQHYFHNA